MKNAFFSFYLTRLTYTEIYISFHIVGKHRCLINSKCSMNTIFSSFLPWFLFFILLKCFEIFHEHIKEGGREREKAHLLVPFQYVLKPKPNEACRRKLSRIQKCYRFMKQVCFENETETVLVWRNWEHCLSLKVHYRKKK